MAARGDKIYAEGGRGGDVPLAGVIYDPDSALVR